MPSRTVTFILLAMLLGVLYSAAAIHWGWADFTARWIAGFGEAFIRLLKLIAVPLVLVSVITGVASLPDPRHLGRMGVKTLLGYLATTVLAVGLGVLLCEVVQPGGTVGEAQLVKNRLSYELWARQAGQPLLDGRSLLADARYADVLAEVQAAQQQSLTVADTLGADSVGFVVQGRLQHGFRLAPGHYRVVVDGTEKPELEAPCRPGDVLAVQRSETAITFRHNGQEVHQLVTDPVLAAKQAEKARAIKKEGVSYVVDLLIPDNLFGALTDIKSLLKVIFFGVLLGMALLFLPAVEAAPLLGLAHSANAAFLLIIGWVMRLAPWFVFALMAGTIVPMADSLEALAKLLLSLLWFGVVALGGLLALAYVVYPLLLSLLSGRWQYGHFLRQTLPVQSLAFSSSSSAATLPITLKCATENLGVPPAVANFVLPIGSTVNMDGTSLYQTVCILFLAQWHGIELEVGHYLLMGALITLSSIGSAAVPSGGLVLMMVVLESLGLNAAWIGIILPLDRLLDMVRTVVNVLGDLLVACVVAQSEQPTTGEEAPA